MREIVIISGKGGTGKTSVCAAFAHLAQQAVISDLDVDAPDLHILLDPQHSVTESFVSGNEAVIRREDCLRCGKCVALCAFDAIRLEEDGAYVDPMRCEGCGVCVALCPAKAFDFPDKTCGEWSISQTRFGPFVHAQLYPGEENSGRLIALLKQQARALAKREGRELLLCDGSPGVGCPVISSLSGATLAVAVVEPTPSGRHDFERVAALCDHFRIPVAVVINKADLNPQEATALAKYAQSNGYTVAGSVPFDPDITTAMIERKAVTETASPLAACLTAIWARVLEASATPRR
ncbi:MAG: ATP-binding protein [Bilophila sp.]